MKSGPDTERREEEWRWVGFTMAGLASAGGRRRRSASAADVAAAAWDPPWLPVRLCRPRRRPVPAGGHRERIEWGIRPGRAGSEGRVESQDRNGVRWGFEERWEVARVGLGVPRFGRWVGGAWTVQIGCYCAIRGSGVVGSDWHR
jgi:hypothetical protein